MTGNEARKTFLDYFVKYNHQVVRSSSLVPQDDPTLLFTNAGMVQFKRAFLGEEKRPYQRATTSQKCVRAGGKHNDLENVGYTARHHTFFEMLGNFSFGDYFKEKAIEFAWDLLTDGYGLPADKLWVSVYLDDDEAHDLWHDNVGVPVERIVRFGEEDNFWAMGDTGPCGPCSEVLLDRGEEHGCGKPECRVGCECDRYLELWNLVFMQFNRDASGTLTPLPKPSIDTGLGLERMASILQDVVTNFDTDLIRPIIAETEQLSETPFGQSHDGDVAMKVIADHSRAAAFLIGDGVLPANEGRGYVLRRIMRRAIRYGRNLGLTKPFLHRTAAVVFDIMQPQYPELGEAGAFITSVIENEEIRFTETLDHGLRILNDSLEELHAKGETMVPGELIFKLYDTFGFPVDIFQDVVRDRKLTLDLDGFNSAMERQRARSRTVTAFADAGEAYKNLSSQGIQPVFRGYDAIAGEGTVLVLVSEAGTELPEAHSGQTVEVVTDATPFYGAAGGQVGDSGRLKGPAGRMTVEETLKDPTGLIIHKGKVVEGSLKKGETVTLEVDAQKRAATALNHTATHILHAVLRKVLGEHVKQAGSLVAPDRLRFDFTHFSQIDGQALETIETMVNQRVYENVPVHTEEMDAEEAFASGATALFEEKYGDRVRVVSLTDFSKELCGGTHTERTGDIGLFKIVSESSVAAGVRRIEAVTGAEALRHVQGMARILTTVSRMLKTRPGELSSKVERLLDDHKAVTRELEQAKTRLSTAAVGELDREARDIDGVKVVVKRVGAETPAALRDLADRMADKLGSGIVVLGGDHEGKVMLIAKVTRDLAGRFHAGDIVKTAAAEVGGGGGGRADMAQAGGSRVEGIDEALRKALQAIEG
jgi:alanyl-tRNA synthetase